MITNKRCQFFFIGIGGISMSALALLLKKQGNDVSGSDMQKSDITDTLVENKIKVYIGHNKNNISNNQIIVINHAIKPDNVEYIQAKKLNLTIINRAELLGIISEDYKNIIAISGTHGKTTTTAMIGHIFSTAKKNPTVHNGGLMNNFNTNIVLGDMEYFITEACEYKDSFLSLNPNVSVITNIECEHMDYFKNINNIQKSYLQFSKQSEKVVCEKPINDNCITFGNNGMFRAEKIVKNKFGYKFCVYKENKKYLHIKLSAFGLHNISNALASIAVCDNYGIKKKYIKKGLATFKGTKRRFEIIKNKPLIIHDYAHHPAELKATINTVREFYNNKQLIVMFQPHTYSRTMNFFNDFITILALTDQTIICKTYSAREKYDYNGSAYRLFRQLKKQKNNTLYMKDFRLAEDYIKNIKKNQILLILGAGDIVNIADSLKSNI